MDFAEALRLLKAGYKVARSGWNGKGMYLRLYNPQSDKEFPMVEKGASDCTPIPWVGMKTADNKFVPWLCSQTDMLANDWAVVPSGKPVEPPKPAATASSGLPPQFQPTMPSEPVPLDALDSVQEMIVRTYVHDDSFEVKARGKEPAFRHFKAHEEEVLSCDWCGSIYPGDLARLIRNQRIGLDPADQKYGWPHKFYLRPSVLHAPVKFYTVHLQDATPEDRDVIEKAMGIHIEFTKVGGGRTDVRWRQYGTKKKD